MRKKKFPRTKVCSKKLFLWQKKFLSTFVVTTFVVTTFVVTTFVVTTFVVTTFVLTKFMFFFYGCKNVNMSLVTW